MDFVKLFKDQRTMAGKKRGSEYKMQTQIPFGNDNKRGKGKGNGNCKDKYRGPSLRSG
jgi:hypothetical protein